MSRSIEEIKADIAIARANGNEKWAEILEENIRAYCTADIPLDRLETICSAEKEGKCVVMPCKVGDTVYYPYAGRVIPKRITQYREILRKSEAIDRWYCLEFSNDETFDADDIGKTVFLTRAEAEKALEAQA